MKALNEHWNEIFLKTEEEKLGWYEKDFSQTIKYLNLIPQWERLKIFVAGVGTSRLIELLLRSSARLVLNDISSTAIEKAKNRYGDNTRSIQWLCHDISRPLPLDLNDIDIWVDRAVLHFLVDDSSIEQYFRNVNAAVKADGYAIFAEFSKAGATRCAGLDVRRYDVRDLEERLPAFRLIASEEHTYINPYGEPRPYIYTLFKKNS